METVPSGPSPLAMLVGVEASGGMMRERRCADMLVQPFGSCFICGDSEVLGVDTTCAPGPTAFPRF